MSRLSPSRGPRRPISRARTAVLGLSYLIAFAAYSVHPATARAQAASPANSPASIPAGAVPALPLAPAPKPQAKSPTDHISAKQAREADDIYLEGAKQVDRKHLDAALRCFEQAVHLNPNNRDYALALLVTRENYVTELVQGAAQARAHGDTTRADSLLAQAHTLDPDNRVVAQHFETGPQPATTRPAASNKLGLFYGSVDPLKFPAQDIASTLSGPIELTPLPGNHNIHLHGDPQTVIRNLYGLYGIGVSFDPSLSQSRGAPLNLDMNNVSFTDAAHVLDTAANVFAVPIQPKTVLIAKDTKENRSDLMPLVEETIYLPGRTNDEMQELANVARNIFDIKEVTASATGGYMLMRGNVDVLRQVNALYDDMLYSNPEVLFDVTLYEVDTTLDNNIGVATPTSAGIFSAASEATSLVSANQSLINEAVAAGLLTLNGSSLQNLLAEVGFLIASGTVTAPQFTNLLGTFGGGIALSGLFLGSNPTLNLALTSSDVRMLEALQMRSSNRQESTFRVGSRYPVITGTYSSGVSGTLPASLSGLNINGTSASSLLSQFLGSSMASVPEFQFEDLGITLTMTPLVHQDDDVSVKLEMKIEALGGSSIDSIPILNNRAIKSSITVPAGKTAMLATLITTTELKDLTGLPGLSELPGFQGTEQDRQKDTTEVLITITPHIVRTGRMQISSRRLAAVRTGPGSDMGADSGSGSGLEPTSEPQSGREPGANREHHPGAELNPGAEQNPGTEQNPNVNQRPNAIQNPNASQIPGTVPPQ
jgi:general secretion pathway protein D